MKNLPKPAIYLITFTLLIAGCKKDHENSSGSFIKHGDISYELSQGILENYGINYSKEANKMHLLLLSSGFKIYESNGQIDSLSGMGHGFSIDIQTLNTDKLDLGAYSYDNKSKLPGIFNHASAVFNFGPQSGEANVFDISSGKLTVIKNGSQYELTFDCLDSEGKIVSGIYKGSLKYYNYD